MLGLFARVIKVIKVIRRLIGLLELGSFGRMIRVIKVTRRL